MRVGDIVKLRDNKIGIVTKIEPPLSASATKLGFVYVHALHWDKNESSVLFENTDETVLGHIEI